MAAADQPMGAAASGRKLGPYWRRKLGMTNPGEMTGQQLQRINLIRRAQGLPPVGGAVGFDTPQAATEGAGPGGNPAGAAPPLPGFRPQVPEVGQEPMHLHDQYRQILAAAHGQVNPGGMEQGQEEQVDPGFNHGDIGGGGVANLRDLLLKRLTGAAPQLTSRAALQHARGRVVGRQGARPILPPRKALPAAGRHLPY
jgi:hypothetical protein